MTTIETRGPFISQDDPIIWADVEEHTPGDAMREWCECHADGLDTKEPIAATGPHPMRIATEQDAENGDADEPGHGIMASEATAEFHCWEVGPWRPATTVRVRNDIRERAWKLAERMEAEIAGNGIVEIIMMDYRYVQALAWTQGCVWVDETGARGWNPHV